MSYLRRFLLINLVVVVAGCGFQLRQSPNYAFTTLFVNLPENDAMGASLRRNIAASGQVTVITDVRDVEKAQVIYEPFIERARKSDFGAYVYRCNSRIPIAFALPLQIADARRQRINPRR
jgi:hypothetical protein